MAASPSHKLGQIIGDFLEEAMLPQLQLFCDQRGLFLDKKGNRGAARSGKKVTWKDKFGNSHDLDFVIEKNGTLEKRGRPLAFIETAWRRYTKHSRNKVQEIQGAILPIAEKHDWDKPFLGTILAGVFTNGSLAQMRSSGFDVMLFSYDAIVAAFAAIGIDVAFDESTPEHHFEKAIEKFKTLTRQQRSALTTHLLRNNKPALDKFFNELTEVLDRAIDSIILIPLHGKEEKFVAIDAAIAFVDNYSEVSDARKPFQKYEIIVRYSNGDKINAEFKDKPSVVDFLRYIAGLK